MSSCHADLSGFEFDQSLIDRTVARRELLSVEIELSRRCNFFCPYCYASTESDFSNELTLDEVHDAVRQAQALGARKVIVLGGEPMIHPRLFETIEFLDARGLQTDLFTNGSNMTTDNARRLFRHGVNVVVKMNSFDRETQDRMCGQAGAYDTIQNALQSLAGAGYPGPDGRPFLAISTIMSKLNEPELTDLWRWARDRGILPYFELVTPQGKAAQAARWIGLDADRAREIFNELREIDRAQYGRTWSVQPPLVANRCQRHKYSCLVDACGDVLPCVGVPVPVGNIRARPLAEILRDSEIIQDLRHHANSIKGPCAACEKAETCYGCRGAAYHLTGDYLASDPTCWHNAGKEDAIDHLPVAVQPYVPHDAPMLAVDTLTSVGERCARTCLEIRAGTPFVGDDGTLDETAYVEMMAQSIAALDGFRNRGNGREQKGFLLGVKSMKISGTAAVGDRLDISVYKAARLDGFGIVEGVVRRGSTVLASGEIKVWHKETDAA